MLLVNTGMWSPNQLSRRLPPLPVSAPASPGHDEASAWWSDEKFLGTPPTAAATVAAAAAPQFFPSPFPTTPAADCVAVGAGVGIGLAAKRYDARLKKSALEVSAASAGACCWVGTAVGDENNGACGADCDCDSAAAAADADAEVGCLLLDHGDTDVVVWPIRVILLLPGDSGDGEAPKMKPPRPSGAPYDGAGLRDRWRDESMGRRST